MSVCTRESCYGRMKVYRDRVIECLNDFKLTGYPERLIQAVYFYAVYRELGLSFVLPFDDWKTLNEEAVKK